VVPLFPFVVYLGTLSSVQVGIGLGPIGRSIDQKPIWLMWAPYGTPFGRATATLRVPGSDHAAKLVAPHEPRHVVSTEVVTTASDPFVTTARANMLRKEPT
jgi:hypothetical protein